MRVMRPFRRARGGFLSEARQVLIVAGGEEGENLQELLGAAGYRVLRSPALPQAQALIRGLVAPALVLVDGHTDAELTGFLSALRRARPADFHALPVVVLGEGDDSGPAGVTEVVMRPYLPPLLLEVVQRLLEQAA